MKKSMILVASLSMAASAFAGPCELNFIPRNQAINGVESASRESLSQYQTLNATFSDFVNKVRDSEDRKWIYSNLFYDREMIAVSPKREDDDLVELWDEGFWFWKTSPINNYIRGFQQYNLFRDGLASNELSASLLQDMHRVMMEGAPEGTSKTEIGIIRKSQVFYHSNAKDAALAKSNPFLSVDQSGGRLVVLYPKPDQVVGLLENAIVKHKTAVRGAQTLEQRVRAHSDFVREFVSIHPFTNGNGRTSRFVLGYLLAQDNLLPPMMETTTELTISADRFYEKVVNGIRVSKVFFDDLRWRASAGLDLKQSPVNLMGRLPREIWFRSRSNTSKKLGFPVDVYDYSEFSRNYVSRHRGEKISELVILRQYSDWLKNWSVHFKETDGNVALYQVKRIPQDYIQFWNRRSADRLRTSSSLAEFYRHFYETTEIHRGISTHQTYTDEELLSYFVRVQNIHLSMNASRQNGRESAILGDFEKFNQLMDSPKEFFSYVADHMNAEGHYNESPFNSTSKLIAVADRFSRGFMTSKQSVLSMKGEMVLSALRPKYGVADFNRLKEIASKNGEVNFGSKYPRQQEVAVAGSIHPSSVTRLEFRDVTVSTADENTGEFIAGDKVVHRIRVLERVKEDPSKVRIQVLDGNRKLISERIISVTGE